MTFLNTLDFAKCSSTGLACEVLSTDFYRVSSRLKNMWGTHAGPFTVGVIVVGQSLYSIFNIQYSIEASLEIGRAFADCTQ